MESAGRASGEPKSSTSMKRTGTSCPELTQNDATKRMKITEEQEELLCWSGPTPSPHSPIVRDCPIKVSEPAYRLPRRRGIRGAVTIEDDQNSSGLADACSMGTDAQKQSSHDRNFDDVNPEEFDENVSEGTEKGQFRAFDETVHVQIYETHDEEDEECMISWSGQPKTPSSPIQFDKPIHVTDPVYLLPRRSTQGLSDENSTQISEETRLVSDTQKRSAENLGAVPHSGAAENQFTSQPDEVQKKKRASKRAHSKPGSSGDSHTENFPTNRTTPTHIPPRDPLLNSTRLV